MVAIAICLAGVTVFSGCEKEEKTPDPNNQGTTVPDPEETITVSMRNEGNGKTIIKPDGCHIAFCITNSNNFEGACWKFATFGKVNGLGNVTSIPTSGWATQVALATGNGYIGTSFMGEPTTHNSAWQWFNCDQTASVTFVRLYVVDWITSNSYIIGAKIQYQSPLPFIPSPSEISASETNINFSSGHTDWYYWPPEPSKAITITPFNANWSVTSSESWCHISTTDINAFKVVCEPNAGEEAVPRTAILTIKVEGLPSKTITVNQSNS